MDTKGEYAAAKEKVEIRLHLVNGQILAGHVFLVSGTGPGVYLWKRVLDFFCESAHFFPLELVDRGVVLVGRKCVVRARIRSTDSNQEDPRPYFGGTETIRAVLSSGESLQGFFFIDAPPAWSRASDHLSKSDAFFHIRVDREDQIINKSQVYEVYPAQQSRSR